MLHILLAAVLSQTAPTQANITASGNILYAGVIGVIDGVITPINNAAKTRSCLTRPSGVPSGTTTTRFGVILISPRLQWRLGLAIPADTPTIDPTDGHTLTAAERWELTGDQYAIMEVQAVPTEVATFNRKVLSENVDIVREEVEVRASPVNAACEINLMRRDDTAWGTVVRCACAKSALCLRADGVTPAPLGLTLSPGSFTPSSACQAKSCVARFDVVGVDATWPSVCPK